MTDKRKISRIAFFFILVSIAISACKTPPPDTFLAVEYREIKSVNDIIQLQDSLVTPLVYGGSVSLEHLSVQERKRKFIELMLPAILVAKYNIERDRQLIQAVKLKIDNQLDLNAVDSSTYAKFLDIYKAKGVDQLLRRMQTPPVSIVLAQASIESGWGTSRFFREANNVFGVWAHSSESGNVIRSRSHRDGQYIYLKKYSDLSSSIYDYFQTLGRVSAYKEFRMKNQEKADPYELIQHLSRYSELGQQYVDKLGTVMRVNELTKYDNYIIHPGFFVEKNNSPRWFASM